MDGRCCSEACPGGAALPSPLSQTHHALFSILTHFGLVGLSKLWGVVVLIQNFDVDLYNGFFACGVPCRGRGLVTAVGSADVGMGTPGGVPFLQEEGAVDLWKRGQRWYSE